MILRLRQDAAAGLALTGEQGGRAVSPEALAAAVAPAFRGWAEPVLSGRGVLVVLQALLRGVPMPDVVPGPDVRAAMEAFPDVARLIAAGRVVPGCADGRAFWRVTALPEGRDPALVDALADLWMRTAGSTTLSRAAAARGAFHTEADAWLAALRAPDARMVLASPAFDDAVAAWSAPVLVTRTLTIRLRALGPESWDYVFGERTPANLLQLGQAIGVAPGLAEPRPWDRARLERFLCDAVPALRGAGFAVRLPETLECQVPELREVALGFEGDTLSVRRTVVFAGLELSLAEAEALVDAGDPLVCLGGKWVYLDLGALRRLLEDVRPEPLTRRGALPLLLAGSLRVAPEAKDVQAFLREMTQPPEGSVPLLSVLRPYQAQGVCWMMQAAAHGLGVCLADDMGLGKTLQTIAFLMTRPGPALVVAPLTVLPVWERELRRFAPNLRVYRHDGADRVTGTPFVVRSRGVDVILTAYGYLWRDYATLRRVRWSVLVLDEAQQIKNPASRQSQAARSLTASVRLALTGTPIENSLDDLWSILDFLNPGLYGSRQAFRARYAAPRSLRRMVSHFLLRRLKSDPAVAGELPPKIRQDLFAPLTAVQAAAYDAALAEYAQDAGTLPAGERTGAMLALLTRLRQICDHPALPGSEAALRVSDSGKLLVLLPLLEEIAASGESVLIFTQFVRMGMALQDILGERLGYRIPFLHGGLSPKERRAETEAFNTHEGPSVLILSLRAGAFGLTLTKANHVIHFDRWWNPAVEAQATDRAHRIGQTRTVVVHTLRCRGTLEDRIDSLLRSKQDLADAVVAATPLARLAALPQAALLDLLKRDASVSGP